MAWVMWPQFTRLVTAPPPVATRQLRNGASSCGHVRATLPRGDPPTADRQAPPRKGAAASSRLKQRDLGAASGGGGCCACGTKSSAHRDSHEDINIVS